ncbi:MAG: UDP-N-acetylmuramate dehydrogenase [Brevinematia bacterium]
MNDLLKKHSDLVILDNQDLKHYTTFRIGGKGTILKILSTNSLKFFLKTAKEENIQYFILGGGSNLLINDGPLKRVFIKLENEFKKVELIEKKENSVKLKVGAGVTLPSLSKLCMDMELEGTEFCISIPGTIGGAVIMNAGAHGNEMKDIVKKIYCFDGKGQEIELTNEEAGFSYRKSNLTNYLITFVEIELRKGKKEKIKEKIQENIRYRANTQPKGFSAGSVFKNPEGTKAWKLIREVGLSGFRINEVMFSEKHANFIINLGNGKAKDVIKLMSLARRKVKENFGINLEPEIKLLEIELEE